MSKCEIQARELKMLKTNCLHYRMVIGINQSLVKTKLSEKGLCIYAFMQKKILFAAIILLQVPVQVPCYFTGDLLSIAGSVFCQHIL